MADQAPRYLIGGGEQLAEEITRPGHPQEDKAHPYTFRQARDRLATQWQAATAKLRALPPLACPSGEGVLAVTLNPTYLAKSYYPRKLFENLDLRHVGSRAVFLAPERTTSALPKHPSGSTTQYPAPQLFVAATIDQIERFAAGLAQWEPSDPKVADDFRKLESVSTPGKERLKALPEDDRKSGTNVALEAVLHAAASDVINSGEVLAGFEQFLKSLDIKIDLNLRRDAGGLCFIPIRAPYEKLSEIVDFTFLRALRKMPRIVTLDPFTRSLVPGFKIELPTEASLVNDLKVAVIDGGLPPKHGLEKWVTLHSVSGVGPAHRKAQEHGLAVTSAFLFGSLNPSGTTPTPYANVDHWRVIGTDTENDDFQLYTVLDRIEQVLESNRYEFVNLSLGPDAAMEDDDVNRWTSTLDKLFSKGETVATVACGNNGEADAILKLNRVQPPSDGVNVIAVGAADRADGKWQRAAYSAVGPGRSPGYVKPDLLAFGGSHTSPFLVLEGPGGAGSGTMGTSFAAPLCMRAALGIRAQFQDVLWAPTIKALLVHHAHQDTGAKRDEVGWGRLSHDLADLVLCEDGEAHIVYQRQMPLTGAVRLYLPIVDGLQGDVKIKATFCFFCDVDPEDALNYTRAGLDIQFRPNTLIRGKPYVNSEGKTVTSPTPPSDSFFGSADFYSHEVQRRKDAQKWETTLSAARTKRSRSLKRPAFDVSYLARQHGQNAARPAAVFALVLTLKNAHMPNLYDRIVTTYRNRLQPLRSRLQVPVRIQSGAP